MPDLGHDLWFGYFLTPDAAQADAIVERAQLADSLAWTCSASRITRISRASSIPGPCSPRWPDRRRASAWSPT